MGEITGVESILEKSIIIDDIKIKEMSVLHFLKYLNGEYAAENLESILELVFDCTGVKINLQSEAELEKLLVYFHSILNLLKSDTETNESDYTYKLDYSFFIAKVMKWYSYSLESVYRLPYSVFSTLLNHITILEAEEDLRMSAVVDNKLHLKNENTKSNYTNFKNSLNEKIKSVINCTITEKANIKKWRQFNGLSDLKKELNKEV